jgi:hypothetical protein
MVRGVGHHVPLYPATFHHVPRSPMETLETTTLARLLELPDNPNPATALALQIKFLEVTGKLDLDTLIALQPRIESALDAGRERKENLDRSLRRALELSPVPSSIPVFGV